MECMPKPLPDSCKLMSRLQLGAGHILSCSGLKMVEFERAHLNGSNWSLTMLVLPLNPFVMHIMTHEEDLSV